MWWVGRIPRQGIHYVRIHYLIDLLTVTKIKSNESLEYDWTNLDKAMDILRENNRYPIFELMGNPSMYWNDFLNKTQLYTWKDLVSQIAQRYLNKYGTQIVYQWLFETWNEVTVKFIINFIMNKTKIYFLSIINTTHSHQDGQKILNGISHHGVHIMMHAIMDY